MVRSILTVFSKKIRLTNMRGLHARASAKFVTCAEQFTSEIQVTSYNTVGSETVIADSIMELLMLGSACGEDILISAKGPDSQVALKTLVTLVENRFGEDE